MYCCSEPDKRDELQVLVLRTYGVNATREPATTISRELEAAYPSRAPAFCYFGSASRRCLWTAVSGVAIVAFFDV